MEAKERKIRAYTSPEGKCPFDEWLKTLKDRQTKARIFNRIDRLRLGNFGDCRSVGESVYELKIHFGPGHRLYFGLVGSEVVLLLCGGDKSTQDKDIKTAHKFWKEYKENA